jgi:hypothetical protein
MDAFNVAILLQRFGLASEWLSNTTLIHPLPDASISQITHLKRLVLTLDAGNNRSDIVHKY